jgi:HD-GYP domain-containing protein (c-di-GMP phosphodiesterase class II)
MAGHVSLSAALADGISERAADLLRRQYEAGLAEHAMAVGRLTIAVCRTLELDDTQTASFSRAAIFHDAGKLEIPSHILNRPAPLTRAAWSVVRAHPERGERLVADVPELADVAPIVRHHHERWDGFGYPDALAGEEIPLGARIVFACDAFDAMTSARPYRPTLTAAAALEEVRAGAGTQFDAVVAAAVVDTVTSSEHLTDGPALGR